MSSFESNENMHKKEDPVCDVEPDGRQPLYLDHLNPDQQELLYNRLNEFKAGKRSIGSETDSVIIFESVDEFMEANRRQTKETAVNTENRDIEELRAKAESIINSMFPDVHKKLGIIVNTLQKSSLVHTTRSYKHKKFNSKAPHVKLPSRMENDDDWVQC